MSTLEGPPKQDAHQISFGDLFWTGSTLIFSTCITIGAYGWLCSVFIDDNLDNSTDTEDELESIHNTIEDNRTSLLIIVACLWITVPLVLTHIYYFKLVCESLFASVIKTDKPNSMVHYFKWMYILSFILYCLFVLCLPGIFIFLASYYKWEFTDTSDDTSYIGYYIQFMLLCGVISSTQCGSLWLGITGSIPWILLLFSNMDIIASNNLCCFTYCCFHLFNKGFIIILMIVFIIIIWLDTIFGAFAWASKGFFDPDEESQELSFMVWFSYILAGIWFIYLSYRTQEINKLVNKANEDKEYSKLRDEQQQGGSSLV